MEAINESKINGSTEMIGAAGVARTYARVIEMAAERQDMWAFSHSYVDRGMRVTHAIFTLSRDGEQEIVSIWDWDTVAEAAGKMETVWKFLKGGQQ